VERSSISFRNNSAQQLNRAQKKSQAISVNRWMNCVAKNLWERMPLDNETVNTISMVKIIYHIERFQKETQKDQETTDAIEKVPFTTCNYVRLFVNHVNTGIYNYRVPINKHGEFFIVYHENSLRNKVDYTIKVVALANDAFKEKDRTS